LQGHLAENLSFAAREAFFTGYAKRSPIASATDRNFLPPDFGFDARRIEIRDVCMP
jgi:hypothetical protein